MNNNEGLAAAAVNAVLKSRYAYFKKLSANDSGETGSHQSGYLISVKAKPMMFGENEDFDDGSNKKRTARISWQDGELTTDSVFTWYGASKRELRITSFGRGFPYFGAEYTGAIFVFTQDQSGDYKGYFLTSDEDKQYFQAMFPVTEIYNHGMIDGDSIQTDKRTEEAINRIIQSHPLGQFPDSALMSAYARRLEGELYNNTALAINNPDEILLRWTAMEAALFSGFEEVNYKDLIRSGFTSVDDFARLAKEVLNRRKSRAGKGFEHHLAALFDINELRYTAQGITEKRKKPDFIFPSVEDYHNPEFPTGRLCTLAAKTTCKDRWRQILNEADRLRDDYKYLCTLETAISIPQLSEMESEKVRLVVPAKNIKTFPAEKQDKLWSLKHFISYVKEMEEI